MAIVTTVMLPDIVAGDTYTVNATITKDGATYDITGATVTLTLISRAGPLYQPVLAHAVSITTAASGIVQLALTAAETAVIRTPSDPLQTRLYVADFKVVESGGDVVHSDPMLVPVRRKITA